MPRHRIVLIEDNRPIREMAAFILKQGGYDVFAEELGEEGLKRVSEQAPHLTLLDLDLRRGIDGLEVLHRLRADPGSSDALVVAFTAFAMSDDRDRLLREGFDGYISKPVEPDAFIDEIASFVALADERRDSA